MTNIKNIRSVGEASPTRGKPLSSLWLMVCLTLLCAAAPLQSAHAEETKQQHVHNMSHHVMPFAMNSTIHLFKMTEFGGIQRVLLKEGQDLSDEQQAKQLMYIRHHLMMEATAFEKGDFRDPSKLHGKDMPGLAELTANADKFTASYFEEPNGAGIRFETEDLTTLTAIHRWFGAQLSEHGANARAE